MELLRKIGRAPKWLTVTQWKRIDEDYKDRSVGVDWVAIVVLLTGTVFLTLQWYYGGERQFRQHFPPTAENREYYKLKGHAWWALWRFGGYMVLPMLVIVCMPGQRLRDYFIGFRNFHKHLWIYVLLFILILPAILIASGTKQFTHTYPFYRLANRSAFDFWVWEGLYALQFLSLEFFFRGFLLRGLARSFGSGAIFVMVVPYCMIHYGKPVSETLGAIGAGVILGTLAMRTRSIWGGVLLHVGVALTMDLMAVDDLPDRRH